MQTKTYFASSVPAALDVARKELGGEAMLLNSKPAPAESRAFGRLEVTFAYEPRRREEAPEAEIRPLRNLVRPEAGPRPGGSELEDLRRQVEALRVAVGGTGSRRESPGGPEGFDSRPLGGIEDNRGAIARLMRNGVSEALAHDLAGARQGAGGLVDEIVSRIPSAPFGEVKPGDTRVLALCGPAGRGKTTSLVKVAMKYGIARRVPVRIYQAGSHGVGCMEQMARYAAILGVPFMACESAESVNLSLSGDGWKGLILIDTPGVAPSDSAGLDELARLFSRRPEIERHLVLRSEARSADMAYVVSRYAALGPLRLLFTGVEESLSTGAMVETMIAHRLGASFFGTGQQIPDDIEETDIPRLARSVCSEGAMSAMAG